jgi:hypothetical protein
MMTKTVLVSDRNFNLVTDALNEVRGPDQQRIAEKGIEWIAELLKKNQDYGSSAWSRPLLAPELPPRSAILVRMSDKINRLLSLLAKGSAEVKEESFLDTMRDLGCYTLLYLTCSTEEDDIPERVDGILVGVTDPLLSRLHRTTHTAPPAECPDMVQPSFPENEPECPPFGESLYDLDASGVKLPEPEEPQPFPEPIECQDLRIIGIYVRTYRLKSSNSACDLLRLLHTGGAKGTASRIEQYINSNGLTTSLWLTSLVKGMYGKDWAEVVEITEVKE